MLEAMLASTASTSLFEGKRFEIDACKHLFSQADRQAMLEMASMLDCHHYRGGYLFLAFPVIKRILRFHFDNNITGDQREPLTYSPGSPSNDGSRT